MLVTVWPSAAERSAAEIEVRSLTAESATLALGMNICTPTRMLAALTVKSTSSAATPAYLAASRTRNAACAAVSKLDRSPARVNDVMTTVLYSSPGLAGGSGDARGEDGGAEGVPLIYPALREARMDLPSIIKEI